MNKREKAILDWTKEHERPAMMEMQIIFGHGTKRSYFDKRKPLVCLAFEAGRKFQADNPKLPLEDHSVYL